MAASDPAPDDIGDAPLSPEEMLALAEDQKRSIEGQRGSFVSIILFAWGIAWLVGFVALWLIDGWEAFSLPVAVAAPVFVGLMIVAGALSAVFSIRADRGLRGDKEGATVGVVYGNLWWSGSLAIMAIGQALLFNGMDQALLSIFYPSMYVLFAGIMYIMAALLWRAAPMLILGAWSIVLAAVAPFAGYPTHYLIFAFGGGGGFLLVGLWSWAWLRRTRQRVRAMDGVLRNGGAKDRVPEDGGGA